jgi:hypothetical protein
MKQKPIPSSTFRIEHTLLVSRGWNPVFVEAGTIDVLYTSRTAHKDGVVLRPVVQPTSSGKMQSSKKNTPQSAVETPLPQPHPYCEPPRIKHLHTLDSGILRVHTTQH